MSPADMSATSQTRGPPLLLPAIERIAGRRTRGARECAELVTPSVEAALRRLEPVRGERLDRVGGAGDDRAGVVVGLEVGEHVVGEVARVAAAGTPDADAQAQELLRSELSRDRAQPVVPGEPTPEARLQAAEVEVALVVDDEQRIQRHLV